jgi:trimethylamine--corrinoid protein Co-methyltransferase
VGGHYLFHPTTFERFRSLTQPEIFNRRSHGEWRLRGSRRAEQEAVALLPERLSGYERPLLDEGVEQELTEFVKRRKEELTGSPSAP